MHLRMLITVYVSLIFLTNQPYVTKLSYNWGLPFLRQM